MSAHATAAAEERLRWLVAALDDPGQIAVAHVASAYDMSGWREGWSDERELEAIRHGRHSGSRPLTIERLAPSGDGEATAVLLGGDGKRWSVTCWVEDGAPHRITRARLVPTPPGGLRSDGEEETTRANPRAEHATIAAARAPTTSSLRSMVQGYEFPATGCPRLREVVASRS